MIRLLAIAALLGLRLAWGFIGPPEARFAAFPPSPRRALEHIGDIRAGRRAAHASHNPLGALMAYGLWGTLAVVIASGIAMTGFPPQVRPETGGDTVMASAGLGEFDDEASEANGGSGEAVEEIPFDHDLPAFLAELPENVRYWHDCGHAQIKENLGFIPGHALHLETMAPRLGGFHIHDVIPPGRDHCPPGSGMIDFKALAPFVRPEHIKVLELSPGVPVEDVALGIAHMRSVWGPE